MRPDRFDHVDIAGSFGALPIRSTQSSPSLSNSIHLALLSLLAASVVVPQLGLAAYGLADPVVRQQVLERPLVAFEIAVALAFWLALFGWPMSRLFTKTTSRRAVEITASSVAVDERRAFGRQTWRAPLAEYSGIAHHIRSSLTSQRHELVLVHPNSRKSVVLLVDEHITQADASRFCALLKLPQIPAGELYRLRRPAELNSLPGKYQPMAA
jgi:hypothetical protein